MSDSQASRSSAAITAIVLTFLFVPLAVVVLFSFHSVASLTLPFEGLSLRWYEDVLGSQDFREAFVNSLVVAIVCALVTLALGTLACYALSHSRSRLRGPLTFLFLVPLGLPGLFLGIALLSFFGRIEIDRSLLTVFVAHFVFTFPFFIILAMVAFQGMDASQEEAAADLGASPWQVFWRVTAPQIGPVLLAASALVFVLSFDEFIITWFVIGGEPTLPVFIFGRLRTTVDPTINVVSTLLLALSLVVLAAAFLVTVRSARRRGAPDIGTGAAT